MTPAEKAQVDEVERQRRLREAALLLLLLALMGRAEALAAHAARTGGDPLEALQGVWMGDGTLGRPGVVPDLLNALADAHAAGYRRAALLAGSVPKVASADFLPIYQATARRSAEQMVATMLGRVEATVRAAPADGRADALRGSLADGGYGKADPRALALAAGANVVGAYDGGMMDALLTVGGPRAKFLRHHTVQDDATTDVCSERAGLTLLRTNPYWLENFVPLHFSCRSAILPAPDAKAESDWLPATPPAPGFGRGFVATIEGL